ncbi:hypothetical protein MCAMS1_01160 [biofilm metagenome]
MKISTLILSITLILYSHFALALRCGHELVSEGDYKDDVIEKCGEPDYVDSHYERRGYSNNAEISNYGLFNNRGFPSNRFNYGQQNYRDVEILVEEWTFNFGRSRLKKVLRFENGRLTDIFSGSRRRQIQRN